MSGLDLYTEEDDEIQKQTHVTIPNPSHPDESVNYTDEESAHEHFQAALSVQNSQVNRTEIVGDFLVAVDAAQSQGDAEPLEEFFQRLIE